jgi:hypothetical protein
MNYCITIHYTLVWANVSSTSRLVEVIANRRYGCDMAWRPFTVASNREAFESNNPSFSPGNAPSSYGCVDFARPYVKDPLAILHRSTTPGNSLMSKALASAGMINALAWLFILTTAPGHITWALESHSTRAEDANPQIPASYLCGIGIDDAVWRVVVDGHRSPQWYAESIGCY